MTRQRRPACDVFKDDPLLPIFDKLIEAVKLAIQEGREKAVITLLQEHNNCFLGAHGKAIGCIETILKELESQRTSH